MFKNALVTVFDKTGLEQCLKPLAAKGMKLVSSGGTARFLKSKGFQVTSVEERTGFPEVLSGRVKTLHPFIHIPLLARKGQSADNEVLKKYQLQAFDLVICNLYPFDQKTHLTDEKLLAEWIDVGGPSLLRAAAKNFHSVTVISSPEDYGRIEEGLSLEGRKRFAAKTFELLSRYDGLIAKRLQGASAPQEPSRSFSVSKPEKSGSTAQAQEPLQDPSVSKPLSKPILSGPKAPDPLYGENPTQKALWQKDPQSEGGLHEARLLQGKTLSFNNLLDLEAAVFTLRDLNGPGCVAVKHNNPCGAALGPDLKTALHRALSADPVSVFGGVLALNGKLNQTAAEELKKIFLEVLIAPDYSDEALKTLSKKGRLRVLKWPEMLSFTRKGRQIKQIAGGFLLQDWDKTADKWNESWKVTGPEPDLKTKEDLLFAWKICAHLKSNSIALVKDRQTLGLGMGQVNRIAAVRQATANLKQFHPHIKSGAVLASDGFFPFADSIEEAARSGAVRWIIQPGGSVRDKETLSKAGELGINMVLTGQRHFKH